jgi:hypothetical protein
MASIMPFDSFLRTSLPKKLFQSYRSFEILSEADLQSYVWMHATSFLRKLPDGAAKFRVVNKLYCGDLKIHPDLVVLRCGKPWICIELKEVGRIGPTAIGEDWDRLNKTRHELKAHRGYLVYLVRHSKRDFPKAHHFPEIKNRSYCLIPIVISMEDQTPSGRVHSMERRVQAALEISLAALGLHQAICKQRYRMLFSPNHNRKPGPKGPSAELVPAVVEMKQRNPRWGCPRIAEPITLAFNLAIDQDLVRRILAHPPWPGQSPGRAFLADFPWPHERKPLEYGSVPL